MPRKSATEKLKCHIHDKVKYSDAESILENVCFKNESLIPFEGSYYCLLHLPTQNKDIDTFGKIFQAKLDSVKEKLSEIEKLPEEERYLTKSTLSYDFRGVWFPSEIYLSNYEFLADAYFNLATFSADANFNSAIFSADANFNSATFLANASFNSVTFADYSGFISTTFSANADFNLAEFSAYADFNSARFLAAASFNAAIFSSNADFISAKFTETSQISFWRTRFYGKATFIYALFAGYIAFVGEGSESVFLNAELDLQNARLEKPERISFHRVRLRPSWFVNTDSRRMVFIDVFWDKREVKRGNLNIDDELKSLEKRGISKPRRLLEIVYRHLAFNAEENNHYEEAAKFRYLAMETKRFEYDWNGWFRRLHWLYWFSSAYGESWKQAALVLLGVVVLFGLLYASPVSIFDYGEKNKQTVGTKWNLIDTITCKTMENSGVSRSMNICESSVYSLYVSALQRPEPKPADTLTKIFIIFETILAPLQAALLALAIRRKFMR